MENHLTNGKQNDKDNDARNMNRLKAKLRNAILEIVKVTRVNNIK